MLPSITMTMSYKVILAAGRSKLNPPFPPYVTSMSPASRSFALIWSKYLDDTPMAADSLEEDTVFDSFAKQRTRRIA